MAKEIVILRPFDDRVYPPRGGWGRVPRPRCVHNKEGKVGTGIEKDN